MPSEQNNSNPLVSVIILNWNGDKILARCLDAVTKQTFQDYKVIVVDNASEDDSMEGIETDWPGVTTIYLKSNLGFAAANNHAANQARGRWLAFLNNDAFPHPDWLENLAQATQNNPLYMFFSSCLIQANHPNLLESTGDILHTSASAWHRDNNQVLVEKGKIPSTRRKEIWCGHTSRTCQGFIFGNTCLLILLRTASICSVTH